MSRHHQRCATTSAAPSRKQGMTPGVLSTQARRHPSHPTGANAPAVDIGPALGAGLSRVGAAPSAAVSQPVTPHAQRHPIEGRIGLRPVPTNARRTMTHTAVRGALTPQ
jgi:hypothetical protein